jgi:hypothetical protein
VNLRDTLSAVKDRLTQDAHVFDPDALPEDDYSQLPDDVGDEHARTYDGTRDRKPKDKKPKRDPGMSDGGPRKPS